MSALASAMRQPASIAQGTSLAIVALGDVHMLFNANRTAQFQYPLAMSGNVISDLADATAADHALSRGAADARYLQPADADAAYLRAPRRGLTTFPPTSTCPRAGPGPRSPRSRSPCRAPATRRSWSSVSLQCRRPAGAIAMADVRVPGHRPSGELWIYSSRPARLRGFTVDLTAPSLARPRSTSRSKWRASARGGSRSAARHRRRRPALVADHRHGPRPGLERRIRRPPPLLPQSQRQGAHRHAETTTA